MVLRSRVGSKVFDYADLMPFGETAVHLQKNYKFDSNFINASFIKTVFHESNPAISKEKQDTLIQQGIIDQPIPFGLMIAT